MPQMRRRVGGVTGRVREARGAVPRNIRTRSYVAEVPGLLSFFFTASKSERGNVKISHGWERERQSRSRFASGAKH